MRRFLAVLSVICFMICGIYAVRNAYSEGTATYSGNKIDVIALMQNPENVDTSGAAGVADIIVKEDLSKTMAANSVAAVVYDFRGFDTIGESFILITAIAGTFIILKSVTDDEKKLKKSAHSEKGES